MARSSTPHPSTGRRVRVVVPSAAASLPMIYRRLLRTLGPQHWWPAPSAYEMIVGAILTQATKWHNVEQAIGQLKRLEVLRPQRLLALRTSRLEQAIRSAGYFRQKAKRLQAFSRWFVERYRGSPSRMFRTPWRVLRRELLSLEGVGPETADAMLLYGGGQPVFVVDAYTRRIFRRHGLIDRRDTYEAIQALAMRSVRADPQVYNEFHALLVAVGKQWCHRRHPACERCPLGEWVHTREVI